ncbi:hypothetical protein [Roseomonas gilardii]|uniref:hypothetical protein n=1 Tax=Roseomonas gilardii TaxID=257708 RepID=UPI0011A48115|nr:hypothetical protein [Roseomonas gilardii]
MPDHQDPQAVRTGRGDDPIAAALVRQSALLRTMLERLDEVVQLLTPKPSDGPTLDELLAGLVTLMSDQTALLRRLDARTDLLVRQQPYGGGALPKSGGPAANGKGDRG